MRPRKTDRQLPACVYRKHGAYYLVQRGRWIRLGATEAEALRAYADRRESGGEMMPGLLVRWLNDAEIADKTRKTYTVVVRQLSAALAEFRPDQVTAREVMALCYLTGQRIGDVLAIRHADIGEDGIAFKQQKTKHRMLVSWSPDLEAAVADAKSLHQSLRGMTLLHTRQGQPFSYSTIRTLWDRACASAKVEDAHIHDIRAKSATDAKKQGIDSKALLGHTSESSHLRYLRSREMAVAAPVSFRHATPRS